VSDATVAPILKLNAGEPEEPLFIAWQKPDGSFVAKVVTASGRLVLPEQPMLPRGTVDSTETV
jgi:hypothetical protein